MAVEQLTRAETGPPRRPPLVSWDCYGLICYRTRQHDYLALCLLSCCAFMGNHPLSLEG